MSSTARGGGPTWSDLARRLADLEAQVPGEETEEHAYVYYGRHFRSRTGALPELRTLILEHHDSVSLVTLPTDNGTWSVGFVAWAGDQALRGLREPARWEAALARNPLMAHWASPALAESLTGVDVMAGLRDRCQQLVVDGEPVATGVVAVGDAWAFVNPATGRGMSIGLVTPGRCNRCCARSISPTAPAPKR